MAFPFLGIFLLLIFILTFSIRHGDSRQKQIEKDFWEREMEANHVRRKDINGLSYITIPLEDFPLNICENDQLTEHEETLRRLSEKKILNLNAYTNTDLKMMYGPANLNDLSEYDANFLELAPELVAYAECLISLGFGKEAIPVLEFGISCGSDNSSNYTILADLYRQNGMEEKIDSLKQSALKLDSLMKQPILQKLEQFSTD